MTTMLRALVSRLLIVTLSSTIVPKAEGAVIVTEAAISADRQRILMLLRADVAAQLEAYGVRPSDAKARIGTLTDLEAAQLSAEIDKAYAGGRDPISLLVMAAVVVILLPFFLLGAVVYCTVLTCKGGGGPAGYEAPNVHRP